MDSYHKIVEAILDNGYEKETRAGSTLALPGVFWEHDMADGFPLLTTRKMPIKSIAVELEGFIKGVTSKAWYQERGCRFWDNWANPKTVDYWFNAAVTGDDSATYTSVHRDNIARQLDDLGPLGYSFQMRRFGEAWDEDDGGSLKGFDQLADVVYKLKNNPNDRRMIVSYWNPPQLDRMALPPCTVAWGVTVMGGKLNLSWFQRSCDWMIGGACDIASMALLQTLLCVETGLFIGKLSALFLDCHIYKNHIDSAEILLSRNPLKLPYIGIKTSDDSDPTYKYSIFDWTHKDFTLYDYDPHEKLDIGQIAI